MNAIELARRAYSSDSLHLKTERSVEAQVIGKITAQLRIADARKESNYAAFAMAIHENRKLWRVLAIDVANDSNVLSDDVRAQVFYLSEFTEIHSTKALKGNADVKALIDINTAIMRGLNAEGRK